MSDGLERFSNNANIACRVHGYGLSLDAITCVKIANEIDALRAKLENYEDAIMEYWTTGNTEKLQQIGCEINKQKLEEK